MNKRVMIATPAHSGDVCTDYALAMAETFRRVKDFPYDLNLRFWSYNSIVAEARNILISQAYSWGFDELVFVDADQGFSADSFYRLLSHPVDVVGYPVRIKDATCERYNVRPEDDYSKYEIDGELRLISVPAIGTGMLRISRKVITTLWGNSSKYYNYDTDIAHICQVGFKDNVLLSEDLYLCAQIRDAGFKVYVDPSYTADHFGRHKFAGNYEKYIAQKLIEKVFKTP